MTISTVNRWQDRSVRFPLVGLIGVLAVSFLAVMGWEVPEQYFSGLLGLTDKSEILTFLGIGMGGALIALQAHASLRRAKAMEDAVRAQSDATEASTKQITAQMRQAWINKLRELLAELTSKSRHYYAAGFDDRSDEEYQRVNFLEVHIQLMLNPNEDDHQRLEMLMRRMVNSLDQGRNDEFRDLHPEVLDLSRKILKREWDRVKEPRQQRYQVL